MIFSQAKDNLTAQKGVCLLFAFLFGFGALAELCWPGTSAVTVDEQVVGPQDGLAYYSALLVGLLIGGAALGLFWWLHHRVCCVTASELGLQILTEPVRAVSWSEIAFVKKTLPNFLNGFYLLSLADGTEIYVPVERESPRLFALGTWYNAPTVFEQLCSKNGVWI